MRAVIDFAVLHRAAAKAEVRRGALRPCGSDARLRRGYGCDVRDIQKWSGKI